MDLEILTKEQESIRTPYFFINNISSQNEESPLKG